MDKTELQFLEGELRVVNLGVRDFGDSLEKQEVDVIYVDWSPPAGGDAEMLDILDQVL